MDIVWLYLSKKLYYVHELFFYFFLLMDYTAFLMTIKCGLCLQGNLRMRDFFISIATYITNNNNTKSSKQLQQTKKCLA